MTRGKKGKRRHLKRTDVERLEGKVRLSRILDCLLVAEKVIEDGCAAKEWMLTEQVGLGGHAPCEVMGTEEGVREVKSLLIRIEHGVLT